MNDQQLAAVKQALEALILNCGGNTEGLGKDAITALQAIISQHALHKLAEDARENGLTLDDWDKIGCVNHDCDECKAREKQPAAIPEGYKLVPDTPTNEMTSAMADALEDPENERSSWDLAENMYRAMLAAAPQQQGDTP